MSSLSLPQVLPLGNSSTTSFDSWEAAAKKSQPRAQSWNLDAKPLPPTPTRPGIPSSKFNVYIGDLLPQTPKLVNKEDIQQPAQIYLKSKDFSSSTSNLPDKLPPRPQLKREAQTEIFAGPMKDKKPLDESIFGEWRAPKYESSDDEADSDSRPLGKSLGPNVPQSDDQPHAAEQHAAEYMSVLHACDVLLPSFDTESYSKDYQKVPSPISGRTSDVVSDVLVPHALRLSASEESQPSSYFSSDSEASDYEGGKKRFRLRAKKAFHSRKSSREKAQSGPLSSKTSKTISLGVSERAGIKFPLYASEAVPNEDQSPPSSEKDEHQLQSEEPKTAQATSLCSYKSTRTTWFSRPSGERSSKGSCSTPASIKSGEHMRRRGLALTAFKEKGMQSDKQEAGEGAGDRSDDYNMRKNEGE
ncbi:hypothetical protein JMJ35_001609 [Cladonia borealis]|uniref:Uncharacterized protein n=1 Tax=Cladonia borealis TaxID=184061 RepID=A0AA39R669_9LECA|nr:hypothetical protein JMJ35_001609 [Cladonia borealis]